MTVKGDKMHKKQCSSMQLQDITVRSKINIRRLLDPQGTPRPPPKVQELVWFVGDCKLSIQ